MGATKLKNWDFKEPSTFALLVDDIRKMSTSEQKLLWIQLNKKRLHAMAQKLDESIVPHNLSEEEIYSLVKEARRNGNSKKKN